jgi:hypothetical protein
MVEGRGMEVMTMFHTRSRSPKRPPNAGRVLSGDDLMKAELESLESQIGSLRSEIGTRLESVSNLSRSVLAGLAAILVLRSDIEPTRFLPLLPTLLGAAVVVWLSNHLMIFRGGRAMALIESKINRRLSGAGVLDHEMRLWARRAQLVAGPWRLGSWLGLAIIGSLGYWALTWALWQGSEMQRSMADAKYLVWGGAALVWSLSAIQVGRTYLVLKTPVPLVAPTEKG